MSQDEPADPKDKSTPKERQPLPAEQSVTTSHRLSLDGKQIAYKATASLTHITNEDGKPCAAIFSVAFTVDTDNPATRPLTFCFNGGPGSSAVWLHLGAFGPKRANLVDLEVPSPNKTALEDNVNTLLEVTDLVFIDPVGTGFSVSGGEGRDEDFFNIDGDAKSLEAFVERYLNRNQRWASPKFLAGESYGTTRTGAMAKSLQENGIELNGLVLVSLAMNFQTFHLDPCNELPYLMFLPTYAATAWFHEKLDPEIAPDLDTLLATVREWTMDVYAPALLRGSSIDEKHKTEVARGLARLTGMTLDEIVSLNLRIAPMRFSKSVLKQPGYTVGRMDGRFVGPDVDPDHRRAQRDPSLEAPWGPYAGLINDYLRRTLEFQSDRGYNIFNRKVNQAWSWGREGKLCYPDTADDLRQAMIANPHLRVIFANGIYDLATPFFAAEYTADHLNLPPERRKNLRLTYYPAGHMMYFNAESHAQLKADLEAFYQDALG